MPKGSFLPQASGRPVAEATSKAAADTFDDAGHGRSAVALWCKCGHVQQFVNDLAQLMTPLSSAGISPGSGEDAPFCTDHQQLLHGHLACPQGHCPGRGRPRAVQRAGCNPTADRAFPGAQLLRLRDSAVPRPPALSRLLIPDGGSFCNHHGLCALMLLAVFWMSRHM